MLVLTRGKNQSLLIGDDIEITIVNCDDGKVKIGIDAPKDVLILRKELVEQAKNENKNAHISIEDIEKIKNLMKNKINTK